MIRVDHVVFTDEGKTLFRRKLVAHDCFNNSPKLIEISLPDLSENAQQVIRISYAQLRELGFVKVAN